MVATFRIDTVKLERRFDHFSRDLTKEFRSSFRDVGAEFVRRMRTRQFRGYSGPFVPAGAKTLQKRSGQLARSLGFQTRLRGSDLTMQAFSAGTEHARIQELGGTIRPKRVRFLTVPLPQALTPSGNLKGRYVQGAPTRKELFRLGRVLFDTTPSGRKLIPVFALKRSVRIPKGRFGFFRTWEGMEKFRRKRTRAAYKRAMRTGD